VTIPLNII